MISQNFLVIFNVHEIFKIEFFPHNPQAVKKYLFGNIKRTPDEKRERKLGENVVNLHLKLKS